MTHDSDDLGGRTDSPRDDDLSEEGIEALTAENAGEAMDPNDEVPVPIAMWPSEIDERAQVVEALRGNGPPPRTDTQVDPATESPTDRS